MQKDNNSDKYDKTPYAPSLVLTDKIQDTWLALKCRYPTNNFQMNSEYVQMEHTYTINKNGCLSEVQN